MDRPFLIETAHEAMDVDNISGYEYSNQTLSVPIFLSSNESGAITPFTTVKSFLASNLSAVFTVRVRFPETEVFPKTISGFTVTNVSVGRNDFDFPSMYILAYVR